MPQEITNSAAYHLARYTLIPEILKDAELQTGEFRLIDIARPVIDRHVSKEDQLQTFTRPNGMEKRFGEAVRGYIRHLIVKKEMLINCSGGMFRNPAPEDISDDELDDSELEEEDEVILEGGGWIYAFTFPELLTKGFPRPIKVGMTAGDVVARVDSQCRASASFSQPTILGKWQVARVVHMEKSIHDVLKQRGKWRDTAPGAEWFNTSPDEVETIVRFVSEA